MAQWRRPVKIGAAILAAGLSRRFGDANKLLLEVDGVPMARRVVNAALSSGLDDVLVVLGHEAERVRQCLIGLPALFVTNAVYERGMGTSVAAAIRAAQIEQWDGAMVIPADLPWISPDDFRAVRHAFEESQGLRVIMPRNQGRPGHPVCFPAPLFPELAKLDGQEGARAVARSAPGPIFVDTVSEGAVRDIDTPTPL